jgi:hypothetical protein
MFAKLVPPVCEPVAGQRPIGSLRHFFTAIALKA